MEQPTPRPSSEQTKAILADRSAARAEEHEQNRQDIIAHLKERELRPEAIAAIVGNIAVETGGSFKFDQMQTRSGDPYDPNTVRFGGYGLFQFDDYSPGQGHRSWYQEYLKDNEKTDSLESQLDYVLDTIFADTQDTNYKYTQRLGVSDAGTLKAYLQTSTNPEQISDAFVDRFEKAGIPHSSRRRDAAMKTFAELSPPDRVDISPDEQFLDQPGEIRDTGEDVPEEKSTYEKIKPYVPILRHFNEGGMTLEKQMELFENGGLKDEGGTTDPVSGNDVPPGSTQEEVRDDIPAQLSEGEFVFPADVVRYIGLEKLMQMRQEAKMGLAMMERMGQMGNSDEAVMSDDIPFELSDLDITDEPEYNVGGFVPAPGQGFPSIPPGISTPREQVNNQQFGIAGTQQSAFADGVGGFIPYVMPQYGQTPMAQAYTPAQQQFVPTQPVPTTLPTPEQFLPKTPTDPEVTTKEYINPETGEKRVITFVGGQPTIAIPDGFITMEEYEQTQPPATEVKPTTPQTTRVTNQDNDDKPDMSTGATIAFGGNIIPGTTQSVENMFKGNLEVGGLGFGEGRAYAMSTFASGQQNIPEGGFATITNITLPRPEGVYAGTGQPLGNSMRMDANIFNKYMAGDGKIKVTDRQRMARVAQHIKEMYTDQGVTGMTVDVDQRMIDQIDEIDSARRGLRNDPNRNSYSITHKDDEGNETVVATVSNKVAQEIASGVDIEAAAFDYDLPAPPSAVQDKDSGESGGGGSSGKSYSVGTISGGSSACFAKGSLFKMSDGTIKKIEDIDIGETVAAGGKVSRVIKGDGTNEDWYMYGNTKVTGSHAVFENNQWKRVENSNSAVPADTEDFLYTLVCDQHKLISDDDVMYSDYDEVDNDSIHDELLDIMNERDIMDKAA